MKFGLMRVNAGDVFNSLAAGKTQREIGRELGYSERTIYSVVCRLKQHYGCRTVEQAVAHHVAERIRANLPLALHSVVDRVLKRTAVDS